MKLPQPDRRLGQFRFGARQQACDGESFATDLKIAPDYDAIRSDPRYHALLRCLKLE